MTSLPASSSVVRAPNRCTEGHGSIPDWRWTRIFSLFHARDILNIPSFLKNVISHILRDASSQT